MFSQYLQQLSSKITSLVLFKEQAVLFNLALILTGFWGGLFSEAWGEDLYLFFRRKILAIARCLLKETWRSIASLCGGRTTWEMQSSHRWKCGGWGLKKWGSKDLQGQSCVGTWGLLLGTVWQAGAAPCLRGLRVGGAVFPLSCYRNWMQNAVMSEISAQGLVLIYTHLALNLCWYKRLPKAVANQDNFVVILNQVTL